jgi:hypothetical protein
MSKKLCVHNKATSYINKNNNTDSQNVDIQKIGVVSE